MTRMAVAIGAVVLGIVAVGALLILYDELSAPPIIIADPVVDGTIRVEVSGAVAMPGVYEVPAEARVIDVVEAAGGLGPDADLGSINLARRVQDESELVIPVRPPVPPTSAVATTTAVATEQPPTSAPATESRVNINSATLDELDSLTGIGPVLAQRIIDYRTANGPFDTVDDLASVSGVSSAMVDEIRQHLTVGE